MDLWVFDNDGTLYDDSTTHRNFMEIFSEYSSSFLKVPVQEVPTQMARLRDKWNTEFSAVALMKEFGIDYSEIVRNTYMKIDLEKCNVPKSDLARKEALDSIVAKKIVFTNNPSQFARRVLAHVGLENSFSDFVGMEEMCFVGKSDIRAFQAIEARHQGFERIIICDDSLKNLEIARQIGWMTVWYKRQKAETVTETRHLTITSFEDLRNIL